MIQLLVASLIVVGLAVAGLSLGVVLGRRPIQGSCGGSGCDACASCPRRRPTS